MCVGPPGAHGEGGTDLHTGRDGWCGRRKAVFPTVLPGPLSGALQTRPTKDRRTRETRVYEHEHLMRTEEPSVVSHPRRAVRTGVHSQS